MMPKGVVFAFLSFPFLSFPFLSFPFLSVLFLPSTQLNLTQLNSTQLNYQSGFEVDKLVLRLKQQAPSFYTSPQLCLKLLASCRVVLAVQLHIPVLLL